MEISTENFAVDVCVFMCLREQYCTNEVKCRLCIIRIIWWKPETNRSLPFNGPYNCFPHAVSAQPKFLHVHLCELGVSKIPTEDFCAGRQVYQYSVKQLSISKKMLRKCYMLPPLHCFHCTSLL